MPDRKPRNLLKESRIELLFTLHGARTGAFSRLGIDGPINVWKARDQSIAV